MPMAGKGLVKCIEELAELQIEIGQLQQVLAKKLAYMQGPHPDAAGPLNERIENEMGDVQGSIDFVIGKLDLSNFRVTARRSKKYLQFQQWDQDDRNNQQSFEHDRE